MISESIWIAGPSRAGKTTRLIEQFCNWLQLGLHQLEVRAGNSRGKGREIAQSANRRLSAKQTAALALVFAANGDNRIELTDRITAALPNTPVRTTTPLAFFEDEVILFWPLLIQRLNLKAQFPVRLRPETEQELATELWRPQLDMGIGQQMGVNDYRCVRRVLDLLLLAGLSGTPPEDMEKILTTGALEEGEQEISGDGEIGGFVNSKLSESSLSTLNSTLASMLLQWREWCVEKGLLTYGIITELYWRYLLPDASYQQHLIRRYRLVLADDVDDYPAIARLLFEFLLDNGATGAFTYNPDGGVRLGLGADPDYMADLAMRCLNENLRRRPVPCLDDSLGASLVQAVSDPMFAIDSSEQVYSIQTTSRSQLLRQTAEVISSAVKSGEVQPQEIAVIAPGLDAIARYTLIEILHSKGIAAESLNDRRPLSSSPIIRSLLTLLALVYPGLGRLVDRDAIAEMLVVLSSKQEGKEHQIPETEEQPSLNNQDKVRYAIANSPYALSTDIDPARAGLLADYCYAPDPELPKLLPVKTFARWDRLGYRATKAYEEIVQWLEDVRSQQQQRLIPSPVYVLDRAIQRFLWTGNYLSFERLSALRQLMETAQHYWEVDARLRKIPPLTSPSSPLLQAEANKFKDGILAQKISLEGNDTAPHTTVGRFIQLLRQGTVTANPFPVRLFGSAAQAVTLANIFQYRASRRFHRWQFWLDASSPLWLSGGAATLYGSPLFLQNRFGIPWTPEDETQAGEERLRRILRDLLSRAGERVYLSHSDLAVNGQEQTGPLLQLVSASVAVNSELALT